MFLVFLAHTPTDIFTIQLFWVRRRSKVTLLDVVKNNMLDKKVTQSVTLEIAELWKEYM